MIVRSIEPDHPEATIVSSMIDDTFEYYGGPYWTWKYRDDGSPQSLIVVADVDGAIVGCEHHIEVEYSLGQSGSVEGTVVGDILVKTDRRGERIATRMSTEGRAMARDLWSDAVIAVMFTRTLGDYYRKLLGYACVPTDITRWMKQLHWDRQLARLDHEAHALLEKHPRLAHVDHRVRLEIAGAPPLEFRVSRDGFVADTESAVKADFVVRIDRSVIYGNGRRIVANAVQSWPTGGFRVSGSWNSMWQAVRVAGAYVDLLRILRS